MKNQTILFIASAMFVASINASAQDVASAKMPVATPIAYTFIQPEVETLPSDMKPMNFDKTGCEITFIVKGEDLLSIPNDALNITSITSGDGKDLSKDRRGRDAWKFNAFFAKISENGNYARFSIFVPTEIPQTIPVINGTFAVKAASGVKTETLTFKTDEKGKEQKLGSFTFAIEDDADDNDDDNDGGVFTTSGNFFSFSGGTFQSDKSFKINMKGDNTIVSEIKIVAGGRTIKTQGHSSFSINNRRPQTAYSFASAPSTPEFTLSVTYYEEVKEVVYKIGK